MTSWTRRTLAALLGATLALGALSACGHRPHAGWNASVEDQARHRERIIERVAGKLDLNDEQKKRLGTLADKMQAQRAALVGTTTDPRAELRSLVAGEKFDRSRAQGLLNEKTAAVASRSPEVIAALGDFYDSLDPTQQAKVREFMEHRRRGWWQRG